MGFERSEILTIINREMEDSLTTGSMTRRQVDQFFERNEVELEEYKKEYLERCNSMMISAQERAFNKTHDAEVKMADRFAAKINDWLDELDTLDITEQDEDGNYINTARFFVIHEAITKLHKTLEKLSGTGSMRELAVLKEKMQMEIDKARLLGDKMPLTIDAPTTKFAE